MEIVIGTNVYKPYKMGYQISHFKIHSLIGYGGFGVVYQVKDIMTKQMFAMKIEVPGVDSSIQNEIDCYNSISDSFFPKIVESGRYNDLLYYVMPVYGESITDLRREHNGVLAPEIGFPIIYEMFVIIRKLHGYGYVHRDIKCSNFLFQKNKNYHLILIDFGLSEQHIDLKTRIPNPPKDSNPFKGTKRFASPYSQLKTPIGRRDDLISWFYSSVELLTGSLPWDNCKNDDEMLDIKKKISAKELCNGITKKFRLIYKHLINLQFDSKPNYPNIEEQLKKILDEYNVDIETFGWLTLYQERKNESLKLNDDKKKAKRKLFCNLL